MSRLYVFLVVASWCLNSACNKYLEEKPIKEQLVVTKVQDLLALLDLHEVMNQNTTPLGEALSDNVVLREGAFGLLNVQERENYIWEGKATHFASWRAIYQNPIYFANVVLDELGKLQVPKNDVGLANYVRGAALFYKTFSYQRLADLYAPPFNTDNSSQPGVVMRRSGNIREDSYRATVEETYNFILNSLQEAASLLPLNTEMPTRPNRAAAYGLLARTMLSMRNYSEAARYSDSVLKWHRELMDFNTIIPGQIRRFNPETIYYNHGSFSSTLLQPFFGSRVDSSLVNSYEENDLRRTVFYFKNSDGSFSWQGSYDGDYAPFVVFDGITVDEMMLIRSESLIRTGQFQSGMDTLNSLLVTRWKKDAMGISTYVKKTASNAQEALQIVLAERRKELVFRGLRWSDIRRFNLEGLNIEVVRKVDGASYRLPANDKRFVLLIPLEVTSLTNIQQTAR